MCSGYVDLLPGVPVFIDGAHAPGQLKLELSKLQERHANATRAHVAAADARVRVRVRGVPNDKGAAAAVARRGLGGLEDKGVGRAAGAVAYVGNLHKWAFTPKGTAFMWATEAFQRLLIPPTLSNTNPDFVTRFVR